MEYLETGDKDLVMQRINEFESKHFNYSDENGVYPDSHGVDDTAYYHIYKRPLTELNEKERNRILLDMKEESEYQEYKDNKTVEYYNRPFTDEELQEPEYWEKEFDSNKYTKYINRSYFE
jgi:hypothetical protein